MPSVPCAVSVADILEVRGGPLRENEVWALLCQCAAAIQDFFIKGASGTRDDTIFAISPTSLAMCREGQVTLTPGPCTWHGTDFVAPEYCSDSVHTMSDTALEKMFLFTLGKTLQVATEYGLRRNEYVSISHHLDSLLEAMCEENPALRIGLRPILEACDLHTRQHPDKSPYTQTISRLYLSVLGTIEQTGHLSSDNSRQSTLAPRSRRRPRHPHLLHHRNSSASSQSPSPTRSRSRSRSLSRSHSRDAVNHPAEKPYEEQNENPDVTTIASHNASSTQTTSATAASTTTTTAVRSRPASSQDLNVSFVSSSIDDRSSLYRSAPAYRALGPMPGLLGPRMGSPAFDKYIKLKERQRRLKAAQSGEVPDDPGGRSSVPLHHMGPPSSGAWPGDMMDYVTDSRSMASLMSYSLGTYMPELVEMEHNPAPSVTHEEDLDGGSLLSSELSFLAHDGSQPHPHPNQPKHSSPEDHKQPPSVNLPSRQKRQREEDSIPEEPPQQQKSHDRPQHLPLQPDTHQQQRQNTQHLHQFGSKDLTPDSLPPREFYGPEFVYRASRPVIRISLPLQGESVKNPSLARRVIIIHLTGQKYEVIVDPCMTGRQLFDAVVTHTALDDFFFFGLTYICEGEHFFLDADTKLHKMAPDGWREGAKGHMPPVTYTVYLRVKFYPESLAAFRHESSQHLLYLQLRRDILEERCMAADDQLLALSGLALHAEFGDYSQRLMGQNYFVPEQYLPARVARRLGMGYVHDRALETHRNALGLAPSQCEIQFIKMVQGLPEYGIHYYKLMKGKNDVNSMVWVGLTQTCLLMAEQSGLHRSVTRALPWPTILKISFNKRRFSVQPKADPATHPKGKPPKVNFFTSSYRKGRYLLQLSTAQHRFHITRSAALDSLGGADGLHEMDDSQSASFSPVNHDPALEEDGEEREEAEEEEEEEREEEDVHQMGKQGTERATSPELEEKTDAPPLKYRSPPPYQHNMDYFLQEFTRVAHKHSDWLNGSADLDLHGSGAGQHVHGMDQSNAVPSGVTSLVGDPTVSPQHTNLIPSDSSLNHHHPSSSHQHHQQKDSPPSYFPSAQSSLGRHVFEVTLQKEDDKGIGLTIVGGETTSNLDLGIFVKSVMADGPAARTGLIKSGDRLIAINGISLEGIQHHEAVQLIRDSVSSVTLLVSQMRVPATIRRKDNGSKEELVVDSYVEGSMHHFDDIDSGVAKRDYPDKRVLSSCNAAADVSHAHHSSHRLSSSSSSPQRYPNHQDFVDIAHVERFQTGADDNAFLEHLRFPQQDGSDGDASSTYNDARDEVLLSEEMLAAAEMDAQSYGSSDINRGLEEALSSDRETQELEILGDIANMAVDNSDTDSDFESAVQATVEGKTSQSSNRKSKGRRTSASSPDAVIYEVVLEKEKQSESLGIITTGGDLGDGTVYIQSLVPGGPADRGGILQPGDRLLEVNNQSLHGSTPGDVTDQLRSVPSGLCLLKVARTKSLDLLAEGEQAMKSTKRSSLHGSRPQHSLPVVTANSLSDEEAGHVTPISPPSAFASMAPTPVNESVVIVPPPPPLDLQAFQVEDENSNNTQSDIDSDVLDSSRSELEKIYVEAEKYLEGDGDDDFDLDAALAAAGGDGLFANLSDYHEDKSGGDLESHNGDLGDVSPTDTIKNESPSSAHSEDSVVHKAEPVHRKSLTRQDRVVDMPGYAVDEKGELNNNQFQEFTVTLQKAPGGGLGFTVVGGVSSTGGCYIKAVLQDPALSDGRLHPGDRLIQVNGQDMTGLSHFEAVTFLRQTPREVSIKVWRYGNAHQSFQTPPQETIKAGSPGSQQNVKGAAKLQEHHTQNSPRHAVSGEKPSESGMDLKQQRHQDHAEEAAEPSQSVKDLVKNLDTPRAVIRPYDYGGQNRQANRQAQEQRDVGEDRAVETASETGVLRIVLEKPRLSDSLGFSLVQRRVDGQPAIFIKTLTQGGIACNDGRLKVGDRLLQVNGVSLIGCSHTKAIRIVKEANGSVVLTVFRSSEGPVDSDDGSIGAPQTATGNDLDVDPSNHLHPYPAYSDSTNSSDGTDDDINNILDEAINFLENEDVDEPTTPTNQTTNAPGSLSQRDNYNTKSASTRSVRSRSKPKPKPRGSRSSDSSHSSGHAETRQPSSQSQISGAKNNEKNSPLHSERKSAMSAARNSEKDDQLMGKNGQRLEGKLGDSSARSKKGKVDDPSLTASDEEENDSEGTWYVRKVRGLSLPGEVSEEWLMSLPVLSLSVGVEERTTELLQLLADAVELEEPMLEFQRLRQMKAIDSSEVAKRLENKPRNRYRNVLPYDLNRIKLQTDDNNSNDYINASRVHMRVKEGEDRELQYIACQGPLEATTGHFWQMVWEAGTNVITMLTQEVELGKVKCHKYWPASYNEPLQVCDGRFLVELKHHQVVEDFDIHRLSLCHVDSGEEREIVHLHYTTWPDHGVPDTAYPMLRFVRLMHQCHRSGPFVVHCSAGIGRSGVLLAVDTALARIENGLEELDLFEILSELRSQRYGMIQTQDQYLFCYTACMEALLSMER